MIEKIIKRNGLTDYFLVVIGFLFLFRNSIPFCQGYKSLSFDNQAFLFWDFTSSLGLRLYKDFFYPYGLLFYLQNNNLVWHYIALGICLALLFSIFLFTKAIFKERLLSYFTFIFLIVFLNSFLDPLSYLRYSPLVLLSFVIAHFANKKTLLENNQSFTTSFLIGLFFSFINDLFFYSLLVYASFVFIYFYLNRLSVRKKKKLILRFLLTSCIGFILGSIPLLFYLIDKGILKDFFAFYFSLRDITLFAKIPFPPTLRSLENVFILATLSISLVVLVHSYLNKKLSFSFYLKLSLFLALMVLEQKNIIRPIYQQISFIALLLFMVLINDIRKYFFLIKVFKYKVNIFILILFLGVFALIFIDRKGNLIANSSSLSSNKTAVCLKEKIRYFSPKELKPYLNVVEYIKKDGYQAIFSFPGDPLFYILFNQTPPYYPSIYEATPLYAQNKLIDYIKRRNVEYVVFNKKSESIQDSVPDRIRAQKLYKYLIENYEADRRIGDFLIMKRKKTIN